MGQSESKEGAKDGKRAELKEIAEQKGPVAMSKYLQENIPKWKEDKVTFAVTGRSATGKSTFINSIRNLTPHDPGYAKSGSGNTIKEPTPYQNPQNQLIVFYDLPGIGTLQFPKETYVSKMELCKYDYFFIFFDKVVNEDENFLICELLKLDKSYCLIRSKIDDDIRNAEDDGRTEEEVIPAIRQQINDQILCYSHLKHCDAIFLISSKRKDIGDWDKLLCHVEKCLSPAKFETFMYSLPTLTDNVIDAKYNTLKKRIKLVAAGAATVAAIAFIGLDVLANIGILCLEVKHYTSVFGLDEKMIDTLAGFDCSQLKCASFLVPGADIAKIITAQLGKFGAILAAESAADILLPIVGSIISAGTSAFITSRYLNRTLDDFRDDARFVYRFILEKQNHQS